MNVCHNNTTLTLNITCLCYLNNSIFSSNNDMLLSSVSISTEPQVLCVKKKKKPSASCAENVERVSHL